MSPASRSFLPALTWLLCQLHTSAYKTLKVSEKKKWSPIKISGDEQLPWWHNPVISAITPQETEARRWQVQGLSATEWVQGRPVPFRETLPLNLRVKKRSEHIDQWYLPDKIKVLGSILSTSLKIVRSVSLHPQLMSLPWVSHESLLFSFSLPRPVLYYGAQKLGEQFIAWACSEATPSKSRQCVTALLPNKHSTLSKRKFDKYILFLQCIVPTCVTDVGAESEWTVGEALSASNVQLGGICFPPT